MTKEEINKRFRYHAPKGDQPDRYDRIRSHARIMACLISEVVPESREQALALTHLEQACMWANAGIARRE